MVSIEYLHDMCEKGQSWKTCLLARKSWEENLTINRYRRAKIDSSGCYMCSIISNNLFAPALSQEAFIFFNKKSGNGRKSAGNIIMDVILYISSCY